MHRISIICVAFNEARNIAGFEQAIRKLDRPPDVSVESILIDGGSRDGTAEAAHEVGFSKVISLPGANIPVCRNRGLREADGDWIAFLDADCEPAKDWLRQAIPLLQSEKPLILGWPARAPEPMTWVQAAWNFHWIQKNIRLEEFAGRKVIRHEGFRMVTTRNMLLHKTVADQLRGFNEDLATGEDTDFVFRAYQLGIPVLGFPLLSVVHRGEPATLGAFFRQQLWHANRRSYRHIKALSGGKIGGNAPRFTFLFLLSSLLAVAGIVLSVWGRCALPLLAVLPLVAIVAAPAVLLCARARSGRHFFHLCILYFAYGLARSIDLAGLHSSKPSWKSAQAG